MTTGGAISDLNNLLNADNRLKVVMVDMLIEIQEEIEEIVKEEELVDKKWANGLRYSEKIIQKKINSLKAESEE